VHDVGAGTGRVSLDLAAGGVTVVGLDSDASLLAALERRASGLPIETVLADARDFDLGRRFSLVLVPMQTLQLLGGRPARAAFLRHALAHLQPAARLAAALADAMDCFDQEHDVPPPPRRVRDRRRALCQPPDLGGGGGRSRRDPPPTRDHRPGERWKSVEAVVRLDRVTADEVAAEATQLGFLTEPCLSIPETEEYLGSTVVLLRAPMAAL